MSIDQQKGKFIFICDGEDCLESLDAETSDFVEAVRVLRPNGWKAMKTRKTWEHYCAGCAAEIEGEG